MMAVPVSQSGTTLALGKPVRLFQSRALQGDRQYDVAGDGRFPLILVNELAGNALVVIVNWAEHLRKLSPPSR